MDLHTAPTEGEIDDLQITGFTRDALDELVERVAGEPGDLEVVDLALGGGGVEVHVALVGVEVAKP
ncbi:hypothetical protein AAV33_09660, partial [Corynebacterium otitidis]